MEHYVLDRNQEEMFSNKPLPELLSLITDETVDLGMRDVAMYHILSERLCSKLKRKFELFRLTEDFDDEILDYFLYLRGDSCQPYKRLKSIRKAASFDVWLVMTFRNLLSKRQIPDDAAPSALPGCSDMTSEEEYVRMLSTLVAYCCQEFDPTSRFIFLRMLLTILDKSRALPITEIAPVLGITDIHYRVITSRIRRKVRQIREQLLVGAHFSLTPESRSLETALNLDFSNWYQILSEYYDKTSVSLPQSEAINSLRIQHLSQSDDLLHENEAAQYGKPCTSAIYLWKKLAL